jgi:hypothetical protein
MLLAEALTPEMEPAFEPVALAVALPPAMPLIANSPRAALLPPVAVAWEFTWLSPDALALEDAIAFPPVPCAKLELAALPALAVALASAS